MGGDGGPLSGCDFTTGDRGIARKCDLGWKSSVHFRIKKQFEFHTRRHKIQIRGSNDFKYYFCLTLQLLSYSACSHLKDQMRYEFGSNLQSKICAFLYF